MCNQDLKQEMKQAKVAQWRIANELGISEMTLIRKMRFELSKQEKTEICAIISKLSAQNN